MESTVSIFPLFSSPVAVMEGVENDFSIFKKNISKHEFENTNSIGSKGSFLTKNLHILDEYPEQKSELLKIFDGYKNNFLCLGNTEFEITTSWITKTVPRGFSQYHNHRNCLYSAVLYFDDIPGGSIEFESIGVLPQQILPNEPTNWNVYNCRYWSFTPEKNTLIIFPSYLYHRVTPNTSNKVRYSLAFNLFPTGLIGAADSTLNVKLL